MRRFLAATAVLLSSCSDPSEGSVTIVTGEETDVFSRAPAAVLLVTEKVGLDGTKKELSRVNLPTDTVSLGDLVKTEYGALSIRGLDATGATVVRGETLYMQWGALELDALNIFAQRTGELARMPKGPDALEPLNATMVVGRYVLAARDTTTTLYDTLGLVTLKPPTLPRPAKSLAAVGTALLVIDEAGADAYELNDGTISPVPAPTNGTFAEVAGGIRIGAKDGTQYIVGGTRTTGGPTTRILVIADDGAASFASTTAPREGACAIWVEGRGLIIAGGNGTEAGAEVLAPQATLATPLPFPADATKGCSAAALDNSRVALVSSGSPTRILELTCTTNCAAKPWPDPITLVRSESVALSPNALFVVGDDAAGASHVLRVTDTGTKEIPLKIPRRGAHLVTTPTAFVIVGGAPGIEQYLE